MGKRRKVVILESEAIIALDLKAMLQNSDCDIVKTFKNFQSLFDYISADSPDIVIIDSNDETVTDKINKLTDDLSLNVIYLSETEHDLSKFNPGKCSMLKKPYQRKDFITAIQKYG